MMIGEKMRKEEFVKEFKESIIKWTERNEKDLLDFRSYRWLGETYEQSAKKRNDLEQAIKLSRLRNLGGIDLATADMVFTWGFGKQFPLRDDEDVLKATREAFGFLENDDCYRACRRLMQIYGVGVAGATKILGLSNQERYCIYDSRVGRALDDLVKDGQKLVRCPPGRSTKGDNVPYERLDHEWSLDYQKLIWTLEVIKNHLKEKGSDLQISDIEMALFMKGRQRP